MDPGPDTRPVRRMAGVVALLGVLLSLRSNGHSGSDLASLQRFACDDGQLVPVRVLGSGSTVVLVHGFGCSHHDWMPVARRLARRHRVLAWDARGHGACRLQAGSAVTLARIGCDLHQMIEHYALERPLLVGHSMGALTVLQYLQDHGTERVGGIVLVDQSPRIVTDAEWRLGMFGGCSAPMLLGFIAAARQNLAESVLREIAALQIGWLDRWLAEQAWPGRWFRHWLRRFDAAPLLELGDSLARADFRSLLPTLDIPVRVVLGARSAHYGGLPLASYYRLSVPHVEVTSYARAGHSPHVSEPGRFAEELIRFSADHR